MLPNTSSEISLEAVKAKAKVDRLRPTEADFKGKPGYERYHVIEEIAGDVVVKRTEVKGEAPDGTYKWRYRGEQNEGGKLTKFGHEMRESLMPWVRADSERQSQGQAKVERITLKDEAGSAQYVLPHQADEAAKRNGWHHHWRVRGKVMGVIRNGRYYRVVDGQLVEG